MNRIDALIEKLASLQVSEDGNVFKKGMFPSERFHNYFPYVRSDSNVFFPASIALILRNNICHLDDAQLKKVNNIIEGIRNNYPFFASVSNKYLYNFYQTKPNNHYPNGYLLSRFKHFILADDADDTALVYMTLNSLSPEQIDVYRKELVRFANLGHKRIRGVDAIYSELPFYGTWFGTGRMAIELEVCVLCNVLTFIFSNNLPLNVQDKGSLELIRRAIDNNDIIKNCFQVSGLYPNPTVILYHISRLCSVIAEPDIYFDTERVIEMIHCRLKTKSILERIILSISLFNLRRSGEPVAWDFNDPQLEKDFKDFHFFIAPMLSGSSNSVLMWLKGSRLFHILFRCDAFYYTLLLEYEIRRDQTPPNVLCK